MPAYKAPLKDFDFLINHFLELDTHADVPGFADAKDLVQPLLEASAQMCEEVLAPLNVVGDKQGLKFENGKVTTPEGFKEAYNAYKEGGWSTLTWPTEFGGQGLPEFLNMPMLEMVCSSNLSFGLTPGLTHGAINALLVHGNDEQKQTYLPKMIPGEWSGVMCLTEPVAGTDLGLLKTRAEPNADGSYKIEGNKIFISAGEQDQTENIIHLVLARLPDAPKGSKGISLFVVPKFLVNADGSLGARNNFSCAGIEHKMGIHASPTCVMNYDGATGWLVGEPHRGLPAMFVMMNTARLYVGVQGLGVGEAAYQNALAYAKERPQGRALNGAKFPEKPADPITVHPDVRRMLYTMKAFNEGARALVMWTALMLDISHRHPDAQKRQEADDFVQLITPILKASLTDGGFETASTAMQIFGGYGYIEEYGASQYLRDSRIAMIYEGTNGVQAMDLVGRKLGYETGRYLKAFFHPLDAFIAEHRDDASMAEFNKPLKQHMKYLQQATMWIGAMGMVNPNHAGAAAVEYLKMFWLVVNAFIWAKTAKIALAQMDSDPEFYKAKLATARFFYAKILPQTTGLLASITNGSDAVMAESEF
ncbi:MAG: acyl-CoA dehydrogenase C-terminal domain-containing protein [Alphaproteobacteria bacterium]|nr:acyl-CoA dehydrogenase C-terminal domain-containing protein [Alphaproteobacteria bacterium]